MKTSELSGLMKQKRSNIDIRINAVRFVIRKIMFEHRIFLMSKVSFIIIKIIRM